MPGNMDDPVHRPRYGRRPVNTLYGTLGQTVLRCRSRQAESPKQEMEIREVIVQGILSIQNGDNSARRRAETVDVSLEGRTGVAAGSGLEKKPSGNSVALERPAELPRSEYPV